ncbi:phosphoribosyltransferase family protein [Algoriphagus namhaensis]|uniref:Phosphoribosyltransferase family protein n=1 Tax=Algoriphagus namhaensis TaxID=915353 RepID=A0ABV8AMC0_9BACT
MIEVLTHAQICKKITRMSYEIYERNVKSDGIVIAGVSGMGAILASLLVKELREISPLSVDQMEILLDKSDITTSKVKFSTNPDLKGKTAILVDDVLNTGKTLAYALHPFLDTEVTKIEIAVLVNRSHGKYPLKPDYTGYELSTTLNEHILVDLSQDQYSVHLR